MSDAALVVGCLSCHRMLLLSSQATRSGTITELASLASGPFGPGLFLITLVVGCLCSISDASLVIGCFSCHRRLLLSPEATRTGTVTELASLASGSFAPGLFLITLVLGCLCSMSDASLVVGCFSCHRRLLLSSEATRTGTVTELASLASGPFGPGLFLITLVIGCLCSISDASLVIGCFSCHRMLLLPSEATRSGTVTELASLASGPFGPGLF